MQFFESNQTAANHGAPAGGKVRLIVIITFGYRATCGQQRAGHSEMTNDCTDQGMPDDFCF